jgi:hypothetical protein
LNKIFDALDIIKINLLNDFDNKYSEITKKQKELFEKLGVPPLA